MTTIFVTPRDLLADSRSTHTVKDKVVGYTDGINKLCMCEGIAFSLAGNGDYWKKFVEFLKGQRIIPPLFTFRKSTMVMSMVGWCAIYEDIHWYSFFRKPSHIIHFNDTTDWVCFGSGSDHIRDAIAQCDGDYQCMFNIVSERDSYTNSDVHCISPTTNEFISVWDIAIRNFKNKFINHKPRMLV